MQKKRTLPVVTLAALIMALTACAEDDVGGGYIAVTAPDNGYVKVGGTITLTAQATADTAAAYAWTVTPASGIVDYEPSATSTLTLTTKTRGTATVTVRQGDLTSNAYTVTVANECPVAITLDKTALELETGATEKLAATICNADALDDDSLKVIAWTSSNTNIATVSPARGNTVTVTAVGAGTATITAMTVNGKKAACTVKIAKGSIALTDPPLGYASLGKNYVTTGGTEVATKDALRAAIAKGGVIVVTAMIDMSDGMLPAAGGKSTDSTPALDAFVSEQTGGAYTTYAAWVSAYSKACKLTTEDDKSGSGSSELQGTMKTLNAEYGKIIRLDVQGGTTLAGKGPGCGIRGGTIQISNASNIQIRNLTIQDAFDPFPHHEKNDGYNAQWDGINIQNTSKNIWIDRCTFEDTLTLGYVQTNGSSQEKWQTYDGLCDMKDDSTNITVSNCVFRNHDKTMLIGSSDSNGDNKKRFVTLQGNYFSNCGQRLPMVRNTTIHILNNYYDADSNPTYSQQYAVGCRKDSIIYAEANYFGSGIKYSFKNNDGKLYASGNSDSAKCDTTVAGSTLFSTAVKAYTYTPVTAEQAKTTAMSSAGAGYTLQ
ncbi:MAG: Ig-like domain-containing protein [Treponemataceae bacterium]|nr:Ig-like domain-containing protein [Treponemataceae bacterium]